ncbi:MAG: DctP family TRAP transporter solute-binding subunit [Pseudomonadota bacterium]|nr:DctP family TRAP transporter solute-binding subunit [Pseudomonadota bacterium]
MHIHYLAAALATSFTVNAFAQAPASAPVIVIKFSHVVASDAPKGQAAERFKAIAEKLTKGRVRVEVYPLSTLVKGDDELAALQANKVQMLAPSLATFGPIGVTDFEVFDMPYIFKNKESLYAVTEGPIGKSMLAKLDDKGIVGLAYWDNGFKVMTSNKPIRTPADFKGQKMRAQASKVIDAQFVALGATPVKMNFTDSYAGMKSGVIDGSENAPSNVYTQKMDLVQKNVTYTNHAYAGYAVVANKKFWDGLPPDIRAFLVTALRDATNYEKIVAGLDNDRSTDAMKKAGKTALYTPTAAEDAAFRKALLPVQQQMESRVGKGLIDSINKVAR